jgi:hypothetical protein
MDAFARLSSAGRAFSDVARWLLGGQPQASAPHERFLVKPARALGVQRREILQIWPSSVRWNYDTPLLASVCPALQVDSSRQDSSPSLLCAGWHEAVNKNRERPLDEFGGSFHYPYICSRYGKVFMSTIAAMAPTKLSLCICTLCAIYDKIHVHLLAPDNRDAEIVYGKCDVHV